MSYSELLTHWSLGLRFEDLPDKVIENTRLRILDVIGLALAGSGTDFGRSVKQSTLELSPGGTCRIWGSGESTTVTGAAFTNGALSQALEFDDTHNRSIVHMSGPSVSAAMALGERDQLSGKDIITAIAIGNEISCRIGSVAPQQFHRRGFHPTGMFAAFGSTWLAGYLLKLSKQQQVNAAGIVGSYAAGLLQCWVDGTQSKFLHPGWASQSGITAATLGKNGTTGPAEVLEGRFGLFASHLQDENIALDYAMLSDNLGSHWESENASFKPFPVAHVIHPYIDALLRLVAAHTIKHEDVARIICPVPEYQVGIVCEPVAEKRRPNSDSHGRVSLQYTLAEALVLGKINKDSYASDSLTDKTILALADKVDYQLDDTFPGPEQFKGQVTIELNSGESFTEVEEHNRGSRENPMTEDEIMGKFTKNSEDVLSPDQQQRLAEKILTLDSLSNSADIVPLTVGN
ncbi:MmgE/PrpD family protein [Gammaproteobacteria bacterium]|jgi:2-methylcitrate dehydratase PrpD|nr:MmgE/PrpD family protein [Gammaproteobacteria bacterium]